MTATSSMTAEEVLSLFVKARGVSTPFIAINTPDPTATEKRIHAKCVEQTPDYPAVRWDLASGFLPLNKLGANLVLKYQPEFPIKMPDEALEIAKQFGEETVLFMHGMDRLINAEGDGKHGIVQAICNLREEFKENQRTLVMLAPYINLPSELKADVLVLDEPLPDATEVKGIVQRVVGEAREQNQFVDGSEPDEDMVAEAVETMRGLPAFVIEQSTAMSVSKKNGFNFGTMRLRKEEMIRQNDGLSVWKCDETFSDIGGYGYAKQTNIDYFNGPEKPGLVLWADEFEKANAGVGTDTSGVKTAMNGLLLDWLNRRCICILNIGTAGTGKSAIGQALGNEVNRMCVKFDIASMQSQYVGSSERNLNAAIKTIDAICDGPVYFYATANSMNSLSPEMQRRFEQIFFFEMPDKEARTAIWQIYLKKFGLLEDRTWQNIDDAGWTGADIMKCCRMAYRLRRSIVDAALSVVPFGVSNADVIAELERTAQSRGWLSATHGGAFQAMQTASERKAGVGASKGGRRITAND